MDLPRGRVCIELRMVAQPGHDILILNVYTYGSDPPDENRAAVTGGEQPNGRRKDNESPQTVDSSKNWGNIPVPIEVSLCA